MQLIDAIEIALELARQNILPISETMRSPELADERDRQIEALNTLEDFATNHLGE